MKSYDGLNIGTEKRIEVGVEDPNNRDSNSIINELNIEIEDALEELKFMMIESREVSSMLNNLIDELNKGTISNALHKYKVIFDKKKEEAFLQQEKVEVLIRKKNYIEKYDQNLSYISELMDDIIEEISNEPRKETDIVINNRLEKIDLFLEVCSEINSDDLKTLQEKRKQIYDILKV